MEFDVPSKREKKEKKDKKDDKDKKDKKEGKDHKDHKEHKDDKVRKDKKDGGGSGKALSRSATSSGTAPSAKSADYRSVASSPAVVKGGGFKSVESWTNVPRGDRAKDWLDWDPRTLKYTFEQTDPPSHCLVPECKNKFDAKVTPICPKCGNVQRAKAECVLRLDTRVFNNICASFFRYDINESSSLGSGELRMALRELGYDTAPETCEKWVRAAGSKGQGMSLWQYQYLVASAKLGPRTLGAAGIVTKEDFLSASERNKKEVLGSLIGATRARMGRRGALCQDFQFRPIRVDPFTGAHYVSRTGPALGDGDDEWELLPAVRRMELREAWNHFDRDSSGFLEAGELDRAMRALGFWFDQVTIVGFCARYGGGVSRDLFYSMMSVQILHRDQEVGIHQALQGQSALKLHELQAWGTEGAQKPKDADAKFKNELKKAYLNLRQTSNTDSKHDWRNLFLTRHTHVGEHAVGVKLYFDLLLLLLVGFGVFAVASTYLMAKCGSGSGGAHLTVHVGNGLAGFFNISVGNLDQLESSEATWFCFVDFASTGIMLAILLLFTLCVVPWSVGGTRLQDLAVQVKKLPSDIHHLHVEYADHLHDHFVNIADECAKRDGYEGADLPVQEVALWRDYKGDVKGVLEQVELIRLEHIIDAELNCIVAQAKKHNVEHALGGAEDLDREHYRRKRDEESDDELEGRAGGRRDGNKRQTRVVDIAGTVEKRYKARGSAGCFPRQNLKLAARIAGDHAKLIAKREIFEERMLEIVTARSAHADLQLEEREVIGAFVVFWCEKARDAMISQYNWSSSRLGRFMQPQSLRFVPSRHSADEGESAEFFQRRDVNTAYAIVVEPTQDPSLQLWENFDVPKLVKLRDQCKSRCGICTMVMLALFVGMILRAGDFSAVGDEKVMVPHGARAWVVGDISTGAASACMRVCDLEFFADVGCSVKLEPKAWVSSNGLSPGDDLGLIHASDRNHRRGYQCNYDWRPSFCFEPYTLESLGASCIANATPCVSTRRLEEDMFAGGRGTGGYQPPALPRRAASAVGGGDVESALRRPQMLAPWNAPLEQAPTLGGTALAAKIPAAASEPVTRAESADASENATDNATYMCGEAPCPWNPSSGRRLQDTSTCFWKGFLQARATSWAVDVSLSFQSRTANFGQSKMLDAARDKLNGIFSGDASLPPKDPTEDFSKEMRLRVHAFEINRTTRDASDLADPTSNTCVDNIFGASQVVKYLGLDGDRVAANLGTCRELYRMGLLGYRCHLLPARAKKWCPETCCTCAVDGTVTSCNTDPVGPNVDVRGPILTWIVTVPLCVMDQEWKVKCLAENLGADASLIYFDVWSSPPVERPCGASSPACPPDKHRCASRWGVGDVCAVRCDGIEECEDGWDELSCRTCPTQLTNGVIQCTALQDRCLDVHTSRGEQYCCANSNSTECALVRVNEAAADAVQCSPLPTEGLCGALKASPTCDPSNPAYNPCACLSTDRDTVEERQVFGCKVHGMLKEVLNIGSALVSHYSFASLAAGKASDLAGSNNLECYASTGPSPAGCSGTLEDAVSGSGAQFLGSDWLVGTVNGSLIAGLRNTFEVWVSSLGCPNCALATLPNGGKLGLDSQGHLRVASSGTTIWAPRIGPKLDDGKWHFIAHSIGDSLGERLFVDGVLLTNRSLADAKAAGWVENDTARILLGSIPADSGIKWPGFVGKMDEVAIFSAELPEPTLRHHMNAATWRGQRTRTFSDRFLSSICQDTRAAASNNPCGAAAEAMLAKVSACRQGNACECLAGLEAVADATLLGCRIGCQSSSSGLQRTLRGMLLQSCGDTHERSRTCETDLDCAIVHPSGIEDPKWICDKNTDRCKLQERSALVARRFTLSGQFCIARGYQKPALDRWQAQQWLAGILKRRGAEILSLSITDGCSIEDELLASATRQRFLASIEAGNESMQAPLPQAAMAYTKDGIIVYDNGAAVGYDGMQRVVFEVQDLRTPGNVKFPETEWNELEHQAHEIRDLVNQWFAWSWMPNSTTEEEVLESQSAPFVPDARKGPTPSGEGASYAFVGKPTAEVFQSTLESCGATEFECSPGVCVACSGRCLCDGIIDCPNGKDENFNDLNLRNSSEVCMERYKQTKELKTTDPCIGAQGLACDGKCVTHARRCDGIKDCSDGADEYKCPRGQEARRAAEPLPPWLGGWFEQAELVQVGCVRATLPADSPARQLRLYACEETAVSHRIVTPGRPPMGDAAAACRAVGTLEVSSQEVSPSARLPWGQTEVDHVTAELKIPGEWECPLGAKLRPEEIMPWGAALLAWQARQGEGTPTVVECFCRQRLEFEPEVYLDLPEGDERGEVCAQAITRIKHNYVKACMRPIAVMILNEVFTELISSWASRQRFKDLTLKLTAHFWMLATVLLFNSVAMPVLLNWHLSMREWHAFVGTTIALVMLMRVFWPHAREMVMVPIMKLLRRHRANTAITTDQLVLLFTNPQFKLADAYAQVACTASMCLIYCTSMPILPWLAIFSLLLRYVADWYIFLRGSARPPQYDEQIALECVRCLLVALGLHCLVCVVVFADQTLFPEAVEGCMVDPSNIPGLREQASRSVIENALLVVSAGCNMHVRNMCMLMLVVCAFCYYVVWFLPALRAWSRRFTMRGQGTLLEDLIAKRYDSGGLCSYHPRKNPAYGNAFKLIDLTASANDQDGASSSSSEEGDSSDDEARAQEWARTADKWRSDAKTGGPADADEREARKRRKEKKEKKEKKRKKDKKYDGFDDEDYVDGRDKKKKKKKKDKKHERDGITSALYGRDRDR